MPWLAKLRATLGGKRADAEMSREMAAHLALIEDDLERRGLSTDQARQAARRRFGGVERAKELHRDTRSFVWASQLRQDLRHALRTLRNRPGFAAAAMLTLALGIGANTAIFSLVNAVLLAPLPFPDPDRLAMLWEASSETSRRHEPPAPATFLDLEQGLAAFESATAWFERAVTLQGENDAEQVNSVSASVAFFQTLGARAALGRVFLPGEVVPVWNLGSGNYAGGDRVLVLSDALWRRRFAADPAIAGKTITMNGAPWQVLGVMPADFAVPHAGVDVWTPWDLRQTYGPQRFPAGPPRDWRFLRVIARLKPGTAPELAQAQLDRLAAVAAERFPATNRGWSLSLTTYAEEVSGSSRALLAPLFGTVAVVLLIACANVASLLMTRTAERQHEMTIRAALGAARFRLVRQVLTESLVLASAAGLLGLPLTFLVRNSLAALAPAGIPRLERATLDLPTLAFTLALVLVSGIGMGLVPAWRGTRASRNIAGRGVTPGVAHNRFLNAMVMVEVGAALTLLAGAGLFARNFYDQLKTDPGFQRNNLLTWHITLDAKAYSGRAGQYYRDLIQRLESLPGVVAAAAVTTLPMSGVGVDFERPYWRAGEPEPLGNAEKVAVRMATPGYFTTMNMKLLRGRWFTDQDRQDTAAVLIVNERMASRVWPGQNPLGQRLMLDYNRGKYAYQVVGVTSAIRYYGLKREPEPEVFIPHAQNAYLPMNVVVRTAGTPETMVKAVQQAMHAQDPTQAGHNIRTMDQLIARWVAADRFSAWLMGLLAAVALTLAAIGIYSVTASAVEQRRQEIGIRMALGAERGDLLRMLVRQAMTVVLAGVAVGLAFALAIARSLRSLSPIALSMDRIPVGPAAILLIAFSLVACYAAARRVSGGDPLQSS